MKRPYISLKVKLAVLERQAFCDRSFENTLERELAIEWYQICCGKHSRLRKIRWLRQMLFHGKKVELDHEPALVLRRFDKRTGKYKPDARDPRYLVYRLKPEHQQKTTGRKPGAERTITTKGSDVWLAKKFRRLEHPKKSKSRIQSRPFPKTKRPFRRRSSSSATRAGKAS